MADVKNGLYIDGVLDYVDLTQSGVFLNKDTGEKTPYGDSVKLVFLVPVKEKKIVQGNEIITETKKDITISLSVSSDQLIPTFEKYKKLQGSQQTFNLVPQKGSKFKIVS